MFLTIRFQSHRRLLRREDLQRLHKKATNDGVLTQAVDAFSEVADCAAWRGFSAASFCKVWDRSSVLSVLRGFSRAATRGVFVHPCISSERRVFRSSLLHPGMELPVKSRSRELPVRSSSRELRSNAVFVRSLGTQQRSSTRTTRMPRHLVSTTGDGGSDAWWPGISRNGSPKTRGTGGNFLTSQFGVADSDEEENLGLEYKENSSPRFSSSSLSHRQLSRGLEKEEENNLVLEYKENSAPGEESIATIEQRLREERREEEEQH
ncbi:hypothetical protein R1sor_003950 [Riccia sorocarpa]|uniref:Uncharacterized protein n=1 Tax=Riccia sorocarpa TaxID=122646 RepID=A0ABD3H3V4_9MARC